MKQKIAVWFVVFSLCITSISVWGHTEDTGHGNAEKTADETETKVTEVSDFSSFLKAAEKELSEDAEENSVEQETENKKKGKEDESENLWQNRRLLVRSKKEFDVQGAESVISGYDDLFVLSYASEAETKAAYRSLKKISELTVEADVSYEATAAETKTDNTENERIHSGKLNNEGNPSNSRDIIVAVLDTGYDEKSGKKDRITKGVDLTGGDSVTDENGHGTAMANTILNHTPDCVKMMPVKAADETGKTSAFRLYLGICYAMEHGADLINISMSAYKASGSEILGVAVLKQRKGEPSWWFLQEMQKKT